MIIGFLITFCVGCIIGYARSKSTELNEIKQATSTLAIEKNNLLTIQNQITASFTVLKAKKSELDDEKKIFETLKKNFEISITEGKEWLANSFADFHRERVEEIAKLLTYKKRPALKAVEEVKRLNNELSVWKYKAKYYEFNYKQILNLYPQFEDEELIDEVKVHKTDNTIEKDDDYVEDSPEQKIYKKLLSKEEFISLSQNDKDQISLDRYCNSNHSRLEIGKLYERQIGSEYESKGFEVSYFGIIEGLEDLGRDIIAKKKTKTLIIQCKNWSKNKTIREKHIFQLYATTIHYKLRHKNEKVYPVFISNTTFSKEATEIAEELSVELKTIDLNKNYPMIKCNINKKTSEKIYHLPFDQKYDYIKIEIGEGESYKKTIQEAVKAGFRRAKKHISA